MPLSTDVNLPKSHVPRFPDKCVVCGRQSPASTVRLMTGSIGWWTLFVWWYSKPFIVKAPACAACSWRLHGNRFFTLLVTILLVVVAIWIVWPMFADMVPRSVRKWAALGLGLVCLSPFILIQVFFPPAFDITAFSDSVDYEFRDSQLAYEFANLNDDAAWVKVE
jgi:hypothetical protein